MTDEEINDRSSKVVSLSPDGRAYKTLFVGDGFEIQSIYYDGELHCEDGPAYIMWRDGKKIFVEYWFRGIRFAESYKRANMGSAKPENTFDEFKKYVSVIKMTEIIET